MAEVLGREIRKQLLNAPARSALKLLPPRRDEVPPPVRLRKLPPQYRELIGDHAEHPGTGKGRMALKREKERSDRAAA